MVTIGTVVLELDNGYLDLTIRVRDTECVIVQDRCRSFGTQPFHIHDEDIRKLLQRQEFKYKGMLWPQSENDQWDATKRVVYTETVRAFSIFLTECMGLDDKDNKQHNCT